MAKKIYKNAIAWYNKKTARYIRLKLNKRTDADIIETLKSSGNTQGYIKSLIRADIKNKE